MIKKSVLLYRLGRLVIPLVYFVFLFMYLDGALFSFIFKGSILSYWRQIIWIVAFFLFVIMRRKISSRFLVRQSLNFGLLFLPLFLLCIYTVIFTDVSTASTIFGLFIITVGVPFVIFPAVLEYYKISPISFFKFWTFIGAFMSIGLIIDSQYNLTLLIRSAEDIEDIYYSGGRYPFLSESVTIFSVSYPFSLICSIYLMSILKRPINKGLCLITAILCMIGSAFTGSRQILFVMIPLFLFAMIYYLFKSRDNKKFLIPLIIVGALINGYIISSLFTNDAVLNRYDTNVLKEDSRIGTWVKGFNDLIIDAPLYKLVTGNGVGFVSAKGGEALKGAFHYESTFYSQLNDCGIFGIVLVLYPFFQILKYSKRKDAGFLDFLIVIFACSYIVISLISPNGATQLTQVTLYSALGLYSCIEYFDMTKSKPLKK